jgi:hypothetical protein
MLKQDPDPAQTGSPYLTAEPVEGDDVTAWELARHLEEHGVDEGHPPVDGRAAERVLGLRPRLAIKTPPKKPT